MSMTVDRARLEEIQPLALEYAREARAAGTLTEPALPKGALFWVARGEDAEPLGYAAGSRGPDGLTLGPVYVLPAHRRAGVGQRLLEEIERWAGDVGIVEVSVAADNEVGISFLESVGYRTRRVLLARPLHGASA
jgi:GNAT superfamily N-acetyltransferase